MTDGRTMLRWGDFRFEVTTAAYQEFSRQTEWRHNDQERVGRRNAVQFMGPGVDEITLRGVIYPHYNPNFGAAVGDKHIDKLREMGDKGDPQMLVSGRGKVFGRWVMPSLGNVESVFLQNGAALKHEFDLVLKRYGDDNQGAKGIIRAGISMLGGSLGGALGGALGGGLSGVGGVLSGGLSGAVESAGSAMMAMGLSAATSEAVSTVLGSVPSASLLSSEGLASIAAPLVQIGIEPQAIAQPFDWVTLMASDYGETPGNVVSDVTAIATHIQPRVSGGQEAFTVGQAAYKAARDNDVPVTDFIQGYQWLGSELGQQGFSDRLTEAGVDFLDIKNRAPAGANEVDLAWSTLAKLRDTNPDAAAEVVTNEHALAVVDVFKTQFADYTQAQRAYNDHDLYV